MSRSPAAAPDEWRGLGKKRRRRGPPPPPPTATRVACPKVSLVLRRKRPLGEKDVNLRACGHGCGFVARAGQLTGASPRGHAVSSKCLLPPARHAKAINLREWPVPFQ